MRREIEAPMQFAVVCWAVAGKHWDCTPVLDIDVAERLYKVVLEDHYHRRLIILANDNESLWGEVARLRERKAE